MDAKRVVVLSILIFFALFIPSRQQCPPAPQLECSAISAASGWVSGITSTRGPRTAPTSSTASSATQLISWNIDPNQPPGQQYVVGYRPVESSTTQWQLSNPTNMSRNFAINMLPFGIRHELIVCYDNVSVDRLPSPPGSSDPIIPECGQCMTCFRTSLPPALDVMRTELIDNPNSEELMFEIELTSEPRGVTVTWTATDRQSPNEATVTLMSALDDVEINTTTNGSNTVSQLVVERGSRYRQPEVSVTNGFITESRPNNDFRRVTVEITEATRESSRNEIEYRCEISGNPPDEITVMWRVQDTNRNMQTELRTNSPGVIDLITRPPSMGTVTSVLTLSKNAPYTMITCVAMVREITVVESNFEVSTGTLVNPTNSDTTSELSQPSASPQSSVPLEIIIPLVAAPAVMTPFCILLGILLYRRFQMMSKRKKLRATVRMNAITDDIPHQPRSDNPANGTMTGNAANGNLNLERSIETSVGDKVEESIMALLEKLPDDMVINPTELKVSIVIGQGEFGVIYKANFYHRGDVNVVAVKTLKGIFTTAGDIESATKEILKMYRFNHVNVMSLIGVCMSPSSQGSSSGGPSMVMPFMAKGSLLDYLRKEASNLKATKESEVPRVRKPLLQICQQIAKGMEYLSGIKFIHRDLAARNCLMDAAGVIKVSDFGLTENLYSRNYFREVKDGAKLPIKWMALESIKLGVFTEKTDMWAYGVTCWEVFTGGSIPYPGLHPREVLDILENGERLKKPKNLACCSSMYKLMCSCWYEQYEERPTFSELVQNLEHFLEVTSDYLDLGAVSMGTIDTDDDDDRASRLSSRLSSSENDEIAPLPDNSSLTLNRHSILDRVISSPNEYAEAGSF